MSQSPSIGRVYRIRLSKDGYDTASGRYYGIGMPVYYCWYQDEYFQCRAVDLAAARNSLKCMVATHLEAYRVSSSDLAAVVSAFYKR